MAGELSFSETVFKVIILSSIVMSLTLNPTVIEAAEIGVVTTDKLKEKSVSHTGRDQSLEGVRRKSRTIQREIEKRKENVNTFSNKETTLINRLNHIDRSLDDTRKRISELKFELTAIDRRQKETAAEVKALLGRIETNEIYVSKRLVALYKLSRVGGVQVLTSAESMYDFFLRKTALERILAHDESVRNTLLTQKELLTELMDRRNAQKVKKIALNKQYNDQIQIRSKEKEKRQKLLASVRSKRSLELAALESLKQAAVELDQTIINLKKQGRSAHVARNPLQKDFITLKGFLKMPVKGTVITRFGTYENSKFGTKGFRNGIHIRADRGEPIYAVSNGRIIYSSWLKGYGNMIIIDHGESYYTVYAHTEELFKTKGDAVDKQEVIATVGDTGSMIGPRLYFEVRHHGKPLDPIEWIKKG